MLRRFRAAALRAPGRTIAGNPAPPGESLPVERPPRSPLSAPFLARGCHVRPAARSPARRLPPYAAMPTSPFQQRRAHGGPTRSPPPQAPIVPQWAERDKSGMAFPVAFSPSYARKRISAHPTLHAPPTAPSPLPPPARSNRKHY
ncbi:hypothetical protein POSPLADRAFT_1061067 [Postia placenta MAD-698-R-SB12]|uniref:Uncharacterized protein n=1 Tax=Postia placenta MAD-698-R-SB12 TaxID=670580 RepID=A0A1X6MNS8_9APHY|nr:hypothetical protein POSPLADRAFT_1061067 [Postia placenta MAD-698-R-SB12]OSX57978.1 hypothetical protein POSPLADRAFT_1061067 [Postia placenta MAD-698-R-SB12]